MGMAPCACRERKGRTQNMQHIPGCLSGLVDLAAAQGPPRPERPVVNCLCCGKIYKTRETSRDVLHVLGAAFPLPTRTWCHPHDITPTLCVSSPYRLCSAELGATKGAYAAQLC